MSLESIKQNAQSIISANEKYSQLVLKPNHDKKEAEKLKKYILTLSNAISKQIGEVKKDVD
ncbi:hypothetical protein HN992_03200 [Candidatus Woesearchaeota archaeon]|jgi:hypothetical protein|nr:hypothetical protein [Candidatus Woesearchaeota archaeon]MBT3438936.1 hypothetical protein [Candidatus Woesearchaeota archaeon]MBT4058178.1 hypothetical protein [Candidatus Woesearchaeota archaeon]MBT4206857.1 hypothetical protein [Candidatus Woesearchaeota archaeon]MBT4731031.1 hypothetical protein [Candidatus Woesearchaeota archaeon]